MEAGRLERIERRLSGCQFERRRWWRFRPDWDHDNCEVCSVAFSDRPVRSGRRVLEEGFVSVSDHYVWVRPGCFDEYHDRFSWGVQAADEAVSRRVSWPCPCCGYLTMLRPPPGTYQICPVCWWEDDAVQAKDETYVGGANGISLDEARRSFQRIGAMSEVALGRVRPPWQQEQPVGS